MPRAKPRQEELHFQRAVAVYLDRVLPAEAYWFSVPNGARHSAREGAKLKWLGMKPGAPDVLVFYRTSTLGLELKARRGTLSAAQKDAHAALERAGIPVHVCRTIDDVKDALITNGLPLDRREVIT